MRIYIKILMTASIIDHFSTLKDPRIERLKQYQLIDIIVLTLSAVANGANGCEAIEDFGKEILIWLRQLLLLRTESRHTIVLPMFSQDYRLFGDDASRIRGNAVTIMTSIRYLCLNLFQQESSSQSRQKKRKAAWSDAYRAKVMFSSAFNAVALPHLPIYTLHT